MMLSEPLSRPSLQVAVVMRRERVTGPMSRWQAWRWVLAEVVPQEPGFGEAPRLLYKNESEEQIGRASCRERV